MVSLKARNLDLICAGTEDNIVNGGPGLDTVYGEPGMDTIDGAEDADQLYGNEDDDTAGRRAGSVIAGTVAVLCRPRSVLAGTCGGQAGGLGGVEQTPVVGDEGEQLRA